MKHGKRSPPSSFRVTIEEAVLEFIEAESRKSPRTETGGVVAGRGSLTEGRVVLTHVSGPGPRAKRTRYSFARDKEYCQAFLNRVAVESQGEVDYLGEWHKHHEAEPRPSGTDVRTAADIARSPDYHVGLCLLLIMGESDRRDSLRVFVVHPSGAFVKTRWSASTSAVNEGEGSR